MERALLDKINTGDDVKKLNIKQLEKLAHEIRELLIDVVTKNGGHLASNLGVVELTLALHYVFQTPIDKLIWDVGHQTYVHKIITGRKNLFSTIREYNGISGFPKRNESIHDAFETGHSSTSISAALGFAKARDIIKDNYSVISVIGDGAMTGGLAFEALNDAGRYDKNFIIILNDNEMSIGRNVGGLSTYLSKVRTTPKYNKVKKDIEHLINRIPAIGKGVVNTIEKVKDSLKYMLLPGILFEELGFTYMGPVDAHNLYDLISMLNSAKRVNGPVLIHIISKKGKGYRLAEMNPDIYHSIEPKPIKECETKKSVCYSTVFGEKIAQMALTNERIVTVTAAMTTGTGLDLFSRRFKDRFFDVGIAEQHAVTFAAGLACSGLRPVVAIYSTFLQRAYDQILHDVCLQKLPVVFAIDRAGLVGRDGETHHGIFDLSYLSHIPNLTIMAPKSGKELENMLEYALVQNGPVAIRYPKGDSLYNCFENTPSVETGKWETIVDGQDIAIIAVGQMVYRVYNSIISELNRKDVYPMLINARFIKPIDEEGIDEMVRKTKNIITIEDNVIKGGLGMSVLEYVNGKYNGQVSVKNIGINDKFISHGDLDTLYRLNGLDNQSLIDVILKTVGDRKCHNIRIG